MPGLPLAWAGMTLCVAPGSFIYTGNMRGWYRLCSGWLTNIPHPKALECPLL